MNQQNFKPEKITKPIQLLGAWLVGLLSISSSFLIAATKMPSNSWESGALVIAAILNVPIFLGAVFLLQTKFRPELQEDSYYSTYLSQKTNMPIVINKSDAQFYELEKKLESIESRFFESKVSDAKSLNDLENLQIGINKNLANYDEVKEKLLNIGCIRIGQFGTDKIPEKKVVAISKYLRKEEVTQAIHLAKDLNFDYYSLFDNMAEDSEEDILIGSYGKGQYRIMR